MFRQGPATDLQIPIRQTGLQDHNRLGTSLLQVDLCQQPGVTVGPTPGLFPCGAVPYFTGKERMHPETQHELTTKSHCVFWIYVI
jgi:hypothetical protein